MPDRDPDQPGRRGLLHGLALGAGQSRRMSVTVETRPTANRVRVIVQRDKQG